MANKKDDFWDIASLLPPKSKKKAPVFADKLHPATVVVDGQNATEEERAARRLFFGDSEETVCEESAYAPDNPFIEQVTVRGRKSGLHLFLGFREDAIALRKEKGIPCPFAPFFSYIPQFYQLTPAQRAYYLYFRDEADAGRYIDTNQSYFLLYIYEIINLPDVIPPEIGIRRMAMAWAGCRERVGATDKTMARWVADYGLLHRVSCPNDITRPFLGDILAASSFKEFYLGGAGRTDNVQLDAVLSIVSGYDYQNSRYAEGETGALLCHHVGCAAREVLGALMLEKGRYPSYDRIEKRYEAFSGALNASAERYELTVIYRSVTATDDWRLTMTAAVKYAENKVRAALSIKSRLSATGLAEKYKQMIDEYFEKNLKKPDRNPAEPPPAYEVLYDAADKGMSDDAAKEIERDSWDNTWRLIPDEEREEMRPAPSPVNTEDKGGLSDGDIGLLRIAFEEGEAAAKSYAKKNGILLLSACERINEAFADIIGDIVLEIIGDDITVIRDYETEVQTFLTSALEYE